MQCFNKNGNVYQLVEPPFASGGEGGCFNVQGQPSRCAKVYHNAVTGALQKKIEAVRLQVFRIRGFSGILVVDVQHLVQLP
jgi:hypothetical protein